MVIIRAYLNHLGRFVGSDQLRELQEGVSDLRNLAVGRSVHVAEARTAEHTVVLTQDHVLDNQLEGIVFT